MMKQNNFKKVLAVNRGVVIIMLVCVGLIVLGFIGIVIASLFIEDKLSVAPGFILVPAIGMILNIWVVLFCSLMMYTVGYTHAVSAGMTRKAYLRSSYLLGLAYTGASTLLSLLSSLVVFFFAFSQTGVQAEKLQKMAWDIVGVSLVLAVTFLLFMALGRLFAYILLQYGAKLMAVPVLAVSALFMLLPRGIDWYSSIPQDALFSTNAILCAAGLAVIAALTLLGRRLIYRQNI